MRRDTRPTIILLVVTLLATPAAARAMCNVIPTTERSFASALGSVDRPYASPGREVTIGFGGCEAPIPPGDATSIPTATVRLTFQPPHAPATTVTLPPESVVRVLRTELTFVFPDTSTLLGELRTGPVTIVVELDGVEAARIDQLGTRDASCVLRPHAVFAGFTALPPSNRFHCLADPDCPIAGYDRTHVLATLDVDGNLLVPWDWSNVFPPGQGFDPLARLVRAGQSGIEAFPGSGRGIEIPSARYVSSHTVTGAVLPPFLDVGPPAGSGPFPGSTVIGTVDSVDGVMRVARQIGDDAAGAIFDLSTRLQHDVGAIVISNPSAVEGRIVDLRSVRAEGRLTALEEFGHGAGTAGLLLYDNQSGRLGRVEAASGAGELPRRVAVSDELAAFYDIEKDATTPDLTFVPVSALPSAGTGDAATIAPHELVATGLYGSRGAAEPPAIGAGVVGGYAGADRADAFFDVLSGLIDDGTPVGGSDLIATPLGIRNRRAPERFAPFGGPLAPLGPDTPGRVFAVGNRAVFLVCDGACAAPDGTPRDTILRLLEPNGALRDLARNPGAPFVFTGAMIGLARYEDALFGGGPSGVADLDGDGRLDGIFLAVYDLEGDRLLLPRTVEGRLVSAPAGGRVAATPHVLVLALDEASAGPMNCDDDLNDRVVAIFNGRTGELLNTREPVTDDGFSYSASLLTFLQPENVLGQPLGRTFLNVMRDSDGDEVPDLYDDCPLHPDLDQRDADHDGFGDACDPACNGDACGVTRTPDPDLGASARRCLDRIQHASATLLASALARDLQCPASHNDCASNDPRARRASRAAQRQLALCTTDDLAALGACGSAIDALVALVPGTGCLATAAGATARSLRAAGEDGASTDTPCRRRVRRVLATYAMRRHRVIAGCQRRWIAGKAQQREDGAALTDVGQCERETRTLAALARSGRMMRARLRRACPPTAIAALGACGGSATATLNALVGASGADGCLVSSPGVAIDRLLATELGRFAPAPSTHATALPCPPRPTPTATPTPQPGSISVRLLLDAPGGRSSRLDVGWNGLAHDQNVLGGAGFEATLACNGGATTCPFFAALADTPAAAPMPMSVGGIGACVGLDFAGGVVGTYDVATGALTATVPLHVGVSLLGGQDQPCPICLTADGSPSMGEAGTCAGGARSGAACHIDGLADPAFGVAAGLSTECPIGTQNLISTFDVSVPLTTDVLTWATTPQSPRCTGVFNGTEAHCLCPGEGRGEPTKPNACRDDTATTLDESVCQDRGDGHGECLFGGDTFLCADQPWRGCFEARDCITGACIGRHRPCFLDPIILPGAPDPPVAGVASPTLVANFCIPATQSSSVNSAASLPGPATLLAPARVVSVR